MPNFEFEFNQRDRDLVLSQNSTTIDVTDYIRLTIYPAESANNIVRLSDDTKGIDGRAIFFSTNNTNPYTINISAFTNQYRTKTIGGTGLGQNDFKIYTNPNGGIYLKPNEIFNEFGLPEGNYRIQIDFLNQLQDRITDVGGVVVGGETNPLATNILLNFYEGEPNLSEIMFDLSDFSLIHPNGNDFPVSTGDGVVSALGEGGDYNTLTNDKEAYLMYVGTDTDRFTMSSDDYQKEVVVTYYKNGVWTYDANTGYNESNTFIPNQNDCILGRLYATTTDAGIESIDSYINDSGIFYQEQNIYKFITKQISTTRKEIRLKLLDEKILNSSDIINRVKQQFNQGTDTYQFKHLLNIGTGDHIPIMNYMFDAVTDGQDNQSLILKLYDALPGNFSNLDFVTIEREVLTTQTQDIFYFSDVPDVFFGDGLVPQMQENWINPDNNEHGFQNLDELAISQSIGNIEVDSLISSSEYNYPNLNTDFNEFENHTFFGSAKKKLENFKTKVETIQGHYSEISSSLKISSSIDGDASFIIQKRRDLFDKINEEIKAFTPYERFLYYDGQSETTASAPGLGKNYVSEVPVSNGTELNYYDGFNVVYKHSGSSGGYSKLFTKKYLSHDKPFFNYSGSVYLSFLLKGTDNQNVLSLNSQTIASDNGFGYPLPFDTKYMNDISNPIMSGSEYQRYILQTSHSYFVPNIGDNDMADLEIEQGHFSTTSTAIEILSGVIKTGSLPIKDSTGHYPTTVITQSGAQFKGSIMPVGDLFHIHYPTIGSEITQSFITDVKVTLNNPTNVLPFDNIYETTSDEWNDWYNDLLTKAETFDTDNIHSFENNLPLYIQESSQYNDMKDFLKLQGEQYDLIRNHIDSMGTIHKRGYKKTNSPPDNTLPMLLSNMGWQAINPFTGSLTETLGSYLSGVTTIDDIKNNTWRKTLNNLIHIYKSKGTKNSVRALLNTYGYPPDVLEFQEFGGYNPDIDDGGGGIVPDPPSPEYRGVDENFNSKTGSFSFIRNKRKLRNYKINGVSAGRPLNFDFFTNNAPINTIELVYKHTNSTNQQLLLEKASTIVSDTSAFDLTIIPSSDGLSSSLEFRLSTNTNGSGDIASNAVSMSTSYLDFKNGQLWNIMLQRMTASSDYTITNEYRLHAALQDGPSIKTYAYVSMSVSGSGVSGDKNTIANENWENTGSFNPAVGHGILSVGGRNIPNTATNPEITGSLAEIRGWSTALSTSKFRQHVLNKFSTVGNTIDSHKDELVYHFKLNENYTSSSISESAQNVTIVDSSPSNIYGNPTGSSFSYTKDGDVFTGSLVYGFDIIDVFTETLQDNNNKQNDNGIIINPDKPVLNDLNPHKPALESLINPRGKKPQLNTSPKLELYRSPQTFINNFILDNLSGFNLETLYGNPISYYSQSYNEFDTFRENFFNAHPIKVDTNKFIRSHENMFNHSIGEALKQVVPGRSTFSDEKSNFGVEIKQTILEKQKYENEKHSIEINPNTGLGTIGLISTKEHLGNPSGSIRDTVGINLSDTVFYSTKEGTAQSAPSLIGSNEVPYDTEISLGNSYVTSSGYLKNSPAKNHYHPPFLQPDGYVATIENPYTASFTYSETKGVKNIPPTYDGSTVVLSKDGTFDYASIANKSYEDVHKNWGRTDSDVQHINFAAPTGSDGTFNTYHIDTRNVFYSIGDTEYYSASSTHHSTFTSDTHFYNQLYITDGPAGNVNYEHLRTLTPPTDILHNLTVTQSFNGMFMGKTRFMRSVVDFGGINGNEQLILPRNHVTKFSQPFKEQMYKGTQNVTNSGSKFLSVNQVDHSSASFYRVKVTGGENQIYVKGTSNPTKGGDDNIIY